MLDSETKRRLDRLRDILVGKLPDPKSQVEQITFGLIYKFMHDMDMESVEAGGKPTFFSGKFKKYSWKELFDSRRGGVDRVRLYSEAIEQMYTHEKAPELFREIFKNSFLPFKDPSTLNMFLKEIDEFHYSHSEKLGDAYEYLLSYMGSQGDAGQFRTPRHIIDFIVEIVDPKKNERILDPACGTAGFLISSYKHIMNKSRSPKGKKLNASERRKLSRSLVGYDISPDMTRISLVNMYLHEFTSPKIFEYDTLSSEDRWNEFYDVILANPPFFSPKGGIQPHSRFGVDSKRAEVLFVDYIIQHLSQNGRAGIIVPEGIIFQTGRAYKALRKKMVEDCLVGVISLPAGVFQPYSGVKTSVLILDKKLSGNSKRVYFFKIENDGFSLGAQRTPIALNDLPSFLKELQGSRNKRLVFIDRKEILLNDQFTLNLSHYRQSNIDNSVFTKVKIGEIFETASGGTPQVSNQVYYKDGHIPWVTIGDMKNMIVLTTEKQLTQEGIENSSAKLFPINSVLIAMYGSVGKVSILGTEASTNQAICAILPNSKCLSKFLYYVLKSQKNKFLELSTGGVQQNISQKIIKDFKIPLPPIEIQHEIVTELDGYQKIIDGARQVIENYKPEIEIKTEWKTVILDSIAIVGSGNSAPQNRSKFTNGTIPFVRTADVGIVKHGTISNSKDKLNADGRKGMKIFPPGSVLIPKSGASTLLNHCCILQVEACVASHLAVIQGKPNLVNSLFLFYFLSQFDVTSLVDDLGYPTLSLSKIKSITVPLPPLEVQGEIVKELLDYQETVDRNKNFIESYTKKIQNRIAKVWGE